MRLVLISQASDLQALTKMLFADTPPAATVATALEHVKRLNPHLDLHRLAAGTALLLPDFPGLSAAGSRAIGGDVFNAVSADISNGLESLAKNVRAAAVAQAANRKAVAGAIATDVVQRLLSADELLSKQMANAQARFEIDQKQSEAALKEVGILQKAAAAELAALEKLLGY